VRSIAQSSSAPSGPTYPFTERYAGQMGGDCQLLAETPEIRTVWKQRLDNTIGLRKVVLEMKQVETYLVLLGCTFSCHAWGFRKERTSKDTFFLSSDSTGKSGDLITGKVTCSLPFSMFFPHY
jgi:hypothetical protein